MAPKRSTTSSKTTNYGHTGCKQAVWNLAKPIRGCDSSKTRQDPYGNKISFNSYGKNTPQGWHIDHIKPQAKGGSDCVRNLQALQTKINITKADSLVKRDRHNQ